MSFTHELEKILLTLEDNVLADDGQPLRKGELTYAEEATQAIIELVDRELPKKQKTDGWWNQTPQGIKNAWNIGYNQAIEDMKAKLGVKNNETNK